jgi:hypothetical protein
MEVGTVNNMAGDLFALVGWLVGGGFVLVVTVVAMASRKLEGK